MLRHRVIPCLDVADGRVVKGTNFVDLVDEGDPPELAERYAAEGADELVFLDITAAPGSAAATLLDIVERTARRAFIPLTVGGGVRTVNEMRDVLRAGADKVSLNTRRRRRPDADRALRRPVRPPGGRRGDRRARATVPGALGGRSSRAAGRRPGSTRWPGRSGPSTLGAGELLVTSIDRDGTGPGSTPTLLRAISDARRCPGHRVGRRRRPGRSSSPRSVTAAPMPSSRPRSSIAGSTRSPTSRPRWPRPGSRSGLVRRSASRERARGSIPRRRAGARTGSCRRSSRTRRRSRPDGRLDGRARHWRRPWRPARSTSTPGRASGCGARARRAATSCGCVDRRSIATATRCSSPSIRSARPATAGRAAASTR